MADQRHLNVSILLVLTFLFLGKSAQAQILTNGGFESGFIGWLPRLASGGSATFVNVTTNVHSGTRGLLVTVNNPGSASNSVQFISSSFVADASNTYVLRFWANSSLLRAKLGINIVGSTSAFPQIPFQISTNPIASDTIGDYQEYLYAFKASGTISIAFNFQSQGRYWLDDVQILDEANNDGMDVPMTYLWQWGFLNYSKTNNAKIGWTGGDNNKSALLPDGSVAWIFNDSYSSALNSFYSNVRGGSSLPRNCVVHQIGTNLVWKNNGNETFFVPSHVHDNQMPLAPDGLYWIGGSVVESNKLLVLLNGLNNSPLSNICMAVATLSLPELTLDGVVTNLTSPGTDNFGDLVKGDDNYYYVYNAAKVARVPVGGLAIDSAWTYWNGNSWVADHTKNVAIPNFQGWSITRLGVSNYAAVFFPFLDFTRIKAQFAPSPMGPWTTGVTVYNVPGQWGELMYMPNICVRTDSNGIYTIGYSDNGSPENWFSKTASDKSWYNPHYVQADLLALSPYTPPIGPNLAANKTVIVSSVDNANNPGSYAVDGNLSTRWSSAYSDPQWIYIDLGSTQNLSQVRLNWETAYGKSYEIQISNDALSWTTVYRTTNGPGGQENVNFAPTPGRYVRLYGTQRGTGWGYSLWDFQVFAPNASMPLPILNAQRAGKNIVLTWNYGTLLESTNMAGPWTTNNAVSPFTVQPNRPQMFYRLFGK
ncbi:MAG TPA: DUF5005 domain-containing protein [Verrucomicrobiae bacterium]